MNRALAAEWHPDKFTQDPAMKEVAQKKFVDIAAAKEVLTNQGESSFLHYSSRVW